MQFEVTYIDGDVRIETVPGTDVLTEIGMCKTLINQLSDRGELFSVAMISPLR